MSNEHVPADGTVSTRRRVLKAAGLVGAGALLPVAADATDAATAPASAPAGVSTGGIDWPQAGADAGRSSRLPDGTAPTADPTERWRYRNDRYHEGVAVVGVFSAYVAWVTATERTVVVTVPPRCDIPCTSEVTTLSVGCPRMWMWKRIR